MSRFMKFAAFVSVVLVSMSVYAETLPPEFTLIDFNGECTVKKPGEAAFAPAAKGAVYPCGTTVETGRKSMAVVQFSPGNECRILAKTTLVIDADAKDQKMKNLKLAMGKVDVNLKPEFHRDNSLQVETPTAICGAIQCHFTVDVVPADGGAPARSQFTSIEGIISVKAANFNVPSMAAGGSLKVSANTSQSRINVSVESGSFEVQVKGDGGVTRSVTLQAGATISVDRAPVQAQPGTTQTQQGTQQEQVTVTITQADGTSQTFSFTQAAAAVPLVGTLAAPAGNTPGSVPAASMPITVPLLPPVAPMYDAQSLE